ncbi:MAG: NAD-dependent protein deacetylase [Lautropia sp.]|nr:NAD-dependent protein deacetylase [Lautropia sp.]
MQIHPHHQAEIEAPDQPRSPARIRPITASRRLPEPAVSAQSDPAIVRKELADWLRRHRRIAVLTGAGISTASGIPDYRGADGQWQRGSPITWQGFIADPALRTRYWRRSFVGWPMVSRARPNAAHAALADWERAGLIRGLITQNVDALHQQAGQQHVIDLHGRLDQVICLDCGARHHRDDIQQQLHRLYPAAGNLQVRQTPDGDAEVSEADLPGFSPPPCPACGGLLKPDVVFFGENVPRARLSEAERIIDEADALLVIGSSLMVYSGYRFTRQAAGQQKSIALLNRGLTRADDLAAHRWQVDCGLLADILPDDIVA